MADENCVSVVMSADDNYAGCLGVCLYSLMKNANEDRKYCVSVLDGGISAVHKNKILQMKNEFRNFEISFVDMSRFLEGISLDVFTLRGHFTISTYYRFFLPEIFPDADKLVYVDCDTVVLKDAAELYDRKVRDDYLLAVRDLDLLRMFNKNPAKISAYLYNVLKLKKHENYFNAGLMLLNLKKMRQDNITRKLLDKLAEIKNPWYVDQCILNVVCEGHVGFLPQNWNFTLGAMSADPGYMVSIGEPYNKDYEKALRDPYIMHFTGRNFKPWLNPALDKAECWWKYARQTPFYEEILYKNLRLTQNVVQQADVCAAVVRNVANYSKNRFNYFRCRLLANLTFGRMRKHYAAKKKMLKAKIKEARRFLKGKP